MYQSLSHRIALTALGIALAGSYASAANAPVANFYNPTGWTAGDALSTYQEWAAGGNNGSGSILGQQLMQQTLHQERPRDKRANRGTARQTCAKISRHG